jgi:hypothetical protein
MRLQQGTDCSETLFKNEKYSIVVSGAFIGCRILKK